METKFKIKQLLINKVIKTRLFKVLKVPQEPVEQILNSIYKIEIEDVILKGIILGVDFKVSLNILYIPQGIGEFERTFSVSFNFFQELNQEINLQGIYLQEKGVTLWPRATANIEKLVIKPQGKNLQVLVYIETKVIVMGLKEYSISEDGTGNNQDVSLLNFVPIVFEDVKSVEDILIHKDFVISPEDNNPWQLAEVYLEGINYSCAINETCLEIKGKLLVRIVGFKKTNPKLQSQYQLLEFSTEKTIEGWESQRGLVIEPHFNRLGVSIVKGSVVISFKAKATVLNTMTKLLKVNPSELAVEPKQLVIEKPILRQREVIELEKEIIIDSGDLRIRPEIFVFAQKGSKFLEGLICLKIGMKKGSRNNGQGQAMKAIEYHPFKVENTLVKEPNLHTLVKARVKVKKIQRISKEKMKCSLLVSIDLLGSEIIEF